MRQQTKIDLDREAAAPVEANGRPAAVRKATAVIPAPDAVDAYGADSFPASDPPGWWAGR